MLDSDECEQLFADMSATLRKYKLDWVVAEVHEQIRFGKVDTKKLEILKNVGIERPSLAFSPQESGHHGKKASFTAREEFSPPEKAMLLINAAQRAIVDTAQMGRDIWAFLDPSRQSFELVIFARDDSQLQLEREAVNRRAKSSDELLRLFDELRKEIA